MKLVYHSDVSMMTFHTVILKIFDNDFKNTLEYILLQDSYQKYKLLKKEKYRLQIALNYDTMLHIYVIAYCIVQDKFQITKEFVSCITN
jgi:hypothetical protein